jgi:hypothetical protein
MHPTVTLQMIVVTMPERLAMEKGLVWCAARARSARVFLDMPDVFAEFETNLRRERQPVAIAKVKPAGARPEWVNWTLGDGPADMGYLNPGTFSLIPVALSGRKPNMPTIIHDVSTGEGTLDRNTVITLALLYFVRDDYPEEEEPYVKIAKDLLRTEFGLPPDRIAQLNRMMRGSWQNAQWPLIQTARTAAMPARPRA